MSWRQQALMALRPNIVKLSIVGDEIVEYESSDGLPLPSDDELSAKAISLEGEYNNTEYRRLREAAYPPIPDQLDMIYWDKINGTDVWLSTIQEIKQRISK